MMEVACRAANPSEASKRALFKKFTGESEPLSQQEMIYSSSSFLHWSQPEIVSTYKKLYFQNLK
jgi:hypothetical protein